MTTKDKEAFDDFLGLNAESPEDGIDEEEVVEPEIDEEAPPAEEEAPVADPDPEDKAGRIEEEEAPVDPANLPFEDRIAGKGEDDLRKMLVEQQSMIGRQAQDLGSLRAQMEALTELEAEEKREAAALAAMPAPPQSVSQPEYEALLDFATINPHGAYQHARQLMAEGRADPGVLDSVLAIVHELDNNLGNSLRTDYARSAAEEAAIARVQPLLQRQQQQDAMANLNAASSRLLADPALKADTNAYLSDVAHIVRSNPALLGDSSPRSLDNGLRAALQMAIGADPTRSQAFASLQSQQLANRKQDAQVETRGAATKDEPLSADQEYERSVGIGAGKTQRDEILDLWN